MFWEFCQCFVGILYKCNIGVIFRKDLGDRLGGFAVYFAINGWFRVFVAATYLPVCLTPKTLHRAVSHQNILANLWVGNWWEVLVAFFIVWDRNLKAILRFCSCIGALVYIFYIHKVVGGGVCCMGFWVWYFIKTPVVVCCHNNESGIFWFDIL